MSRPRRSRKQQRASRRSRRLSSWPTRRLRRWLRRRQSRRRITIGWRIWTITWMTCWPSYDLFWLYCKHTHSKGHINQFYFKWRCRLYFSVLGVGLAVFGGSAGLMMMLVSLLLKSSEWMNSELVWLISYYSSLMKLSWFDCCYPLFWPTTAWWFLANIFDRYSCAFLYFCRLRVL